MSADCFTVVKFMQCLPKSVIVQPSTSTKQRMLCSEEKTYSGIDKEAHSSGELTKSSQGFIWHLVKTEIGIKNKTGASLRVRFLSWTRGSNFTPHINTVSPTQLTCLVNVFKGKFKKNWPVFDFDKAHWSWISCQNVYLSVAILTQLWMLRSDQGSVHSCSIVFTSKEDTHISWHG